MENTNKNTQKVKENEVKAIVNENEEIKEETTQKVVLKITGKVKSEYSRFEKKYLSKFEFPLSDDGKCKKDLKLNERQLYILSKNGGQCPVSIVELIGKNSGAKYYRIVVNFTDNYFEYFNLDREDMEVLKFCYPDIYN